MAPSVPAYFVGLFDLSFLALGATVSNLGLKWLLSKQKSSL